MSRIGKNPISIPAGVTVEVSETVVTVKGKLGQLTQDYSDVIVKVEEGQLTVERPSDSKDHRAKHGLYRSLISNMVTGVSEGCILYKSPSPRDRQKSRMPSSA